MPKSRECLNPNQRYLIMRRSRLVSLATLLIGGLGGWAAASGAFDSPLKAHPNEGRQTSEYPDVCVAQGGDCCGTAERSAILAQVAAHNTKVSANLQQAGAKPNVLFIMGDDIGWMQPSCYHRGLMVGETPNIDRLAKEGGLFLSYYAESSCTSGRNAFITGMNPMRTGMIPPQLPGSPSYLRPGTPCIAKFLPDLDYTT